MCTVHALPPELLEQILVNTEPHDVASFAQTCRTHRALVYYTPDQVLWRELYLADLDDPRQCVDHLCRPVDVRDFDWRAKLQAVVRATTVASNPAVCRSDERIPVLQTLLDLCTRYPPLKPNDKLLKPSKNLIFAAVLLRNGALLTGPDEASADEDAHLRARLRTMLGLTPMDGHPEARVRSRCVVYDLRRYGWGNRFGPFRSDGSGLVDWEHLAAVHHVMSMHVVDVGGQSDGFSFAIFPMSMPFCQAVAKADDQDGANEDWAGVRGTWSVAFAFCDHRELLGSYSSYHISFAKLTVL
jgi:hypothetical protein